MIAAMRHVRARRLRDAEAGVSAVEFGLLAPVFLIILAGAVDLGGMLLTRLGLNESLSAGANYAIVNAGGVGATGGSALAGQLAMLVGGSEVSVAVTVNNGPTAAFTDGAVETGGTPAPANLCYCPATGAGGVDWGAAAICGTACPDGGSAGRFVVIEASRPYRPLLFGYGMAGDGEISVRAVIQTE